MKIDNIDQLNALIGKIKQEHSSKEQARIYANLAREIFKIHQSLKEMIPQLENEINTLSNDLNNLLFPATDDLVKIASEESAFAQKYRGKKVKKSTQKIYDEIEKEYKRIGREFGQPSYSLASFKVARKHKQNQRKLYGSFMKYKNRLYPKSKGNRHP